MSNYTIAIHGGAGTIVKDDMTPELEQAYIQAMNDALSAGYAVLEKGGTAINAVKVACIVLEDNVLFNAGRGSVFTKAGDHEMDAAIMDGATLKAGSVAGVRNVRNAAQQPCFFKW
jgi:beta-aspartyl-peptidase (threonine type)